MSWIKQQDHPAFESIDWSKPEQARFAGKILVIGGSSSFSAVAECYNQVLSAGAGEARAILPLNLSKQLPNGLLEVMWAQNGPSGGFGKDSYKEFMNFGQWADVILIAGDVGRNSETSIAFTEFSRITKKPTIFTKDSISAINHDSEQTLNNPNLYLFANIGQLQNILKGKTQNVPTIDMGLVKFVEVMEQLGEEFACTFATLSNQSLVIAQSGKVSTTKIDKRTEDLWQLSSSATASVYLAQHPGMNFEALTTAAWQLS